ncbi:signal recognition particle protein [Heliobacillus mobilis]|uniref:Signal recognition particle protein n=2 Tax=Heliobacterium TaxID=2697 RepID=A0A6I3SGC6_HELMO|nr:MULTISPECIES: signal recognition particle protein [Heliobacterium]MBC9783373.1 signal recognition particle protein [Heliobacterium chlorum]MTV47681.1 signal recognition particle protein [Heliobacterium mobile]
MFEGLAEKLQNTLKKLRGKGKVTEADVAEAMREVRMALLAADVNLKVVKDFVARVKERAIGQDVLESLTPGQQVVKVVHDELIQLMGGTTSKLNMSSKPPTVVMLVGLQGAGKTTTVAKLGLYLRKQGRRPLLVACDVYRPAAVKQLQVLGNQLDLPVFSMGTGVSPVDIARGATEYAVAQGRDVILLDTAGRLHINEELMDELKSIKSTVKPHEIMLVVDAMTGQDAVNVADSFHKQLGLDGVVLTKLDGDARGGAALSVKAVTGCPIKFAGMGEKPDALEPFHPDRLASRILGMGDVLSLIEKAQSTFDAKMAKEMEQKLRKSDFNFEDFLFQVQQMQKMGPLDQLVGMLPGMGKMKALKDVQFDEKEIKHVEAIILSMTPEERQNPQILKDSRKRRIAKGSGTSVQQVNNLIKTYEQTRKMFKQFADMRGKGPGKGPGGKGKGMFKLPFMK